ncbi:MAG TPA: hypothetical protein DDW52_19655 [Planctomycetaceae bacterium]|nr:hypothetical protein [Planctomycetaceae bacterium]
MPTHPHLPSDAESQTAAQSWAREIWALAPNTQASVVWFESPNAKGRRTKPSVERATREMGDAVLANDIVRARLAISAVAHLDGVAWCESVAELAATLEDRIRFDQVCWDEQLVTDRFVSLVCWRE